MAISNKNIKRYTVFPRSSFLPEIGDIRGVQPLVNRVAGWE